MTRIDLTEDWTLAAVSGPVPATLPEGIPATVPGCVHTDLLAASLIPDPYLDLNESQVQWIGESDFVYRTRFDAAPLDDERVDLVCEGLDTIATLTFNGSTIGETRNQHRSYRFDVGSLLTSHDNELSIRFDSALTEARAAEKRIGAKPFVGNALPYNAIRKMAANFGWDWGPVLVTAGIWRPIYLHRWSTARLDRVVPLATVTSDGQGKVTISVDVERASDKPLEVRARLAGFEAAEVASTTVDGTATTLELTVEQPRRWWPRGYGDQPLYDLTVELFDGDRILDSFDREIGFRTVEARLEPDDHGTGFSFYVNDERVFIKGANWIPDDCFLSRVTRDDYTAGVRDATDAGFNLLRIWGGGIFESDDLYDLCNHEGILVWQDFLFACAAYSEAPELWDEVEAEVRENVARLAPNPSLVFYNGSNENVEGYYKWGWKGRMDEGEDWGSGYYDRLLPSILADIDPTRPYQASSPFSPHDESEPRDPDHGTVHSWEVWNRQDYTAYRDAIPRFVSEFGFQGPPNFATLTRAVHDSPLAPDSPGVLAHQKAEDGNGKLRRGYESHLPEPTDFDDWHFTTQLNQAHAITYGVEHFRSHYPRTTGTVIWQLNDCWPVTSWAAVDGDRRRKPLWYALRALNAERLLTFQPRDGHLALVASNDGPDAWSETIAVRRLSFDGDELASQRILIEAASRETVTVQLEEDLTNASDPRGEVLVATSETAHRALWYFAEDKELDLRAPDLECTVHRTDNGYTVEVSARVMIKDLTINPDRLDPSASVDEMLITLLPNERAELHIDTAATLDEAALVAHPVLQSVNHLLARARISADD